MIASDLDILEWFHERAAIIEYDSGRDRLTASKLAGICVRKTFGRVPMCVLDVVKRLEVKN